MNWFVIAEKEFADASRSRVLWGLIAFVAIMVSATTAIPRFIPGLDGGGVISGFGAASEFAGMLVPIVALVAAYLAIAGERESGSLRILLGLEPNRGTVVLGKFVGRSAVVTVGVTAGFLVAGGVAYILYGTLPVIAFLAVLALTAALGVAFVGVAIGISAATDTRARAMTVGIAAYLGLAVLWDLIPQGAYLLAKGSAPNGPIPSWFVLLEGLSPSGAYSALVREALHAVDGSVPSITTGVADPAIYVTWWTFAAILVAWTALPVLAGNLAFARADLH